MSNTSEINNIDEIREEQLTQKKQQNHAKKTANELRGDTTLMNMLRAAIRSTANDEGWAKLSKVGSHLRGSTSFDPQKYGHARLSGLMDKRTLKYVTTRKNKSTGLISLNFPQSRLPQQRKAHIVTPSAGRKDGAVESGNTAFRL